MSRAIFLLGLLRPHWAPWYKNMLSYFDTVRDKDGNATHMFSTIRCSYYVSLRNAARPIAHRRGCMLR